MGGEFKQWRTTAKGCACVHAPVIVADVITLPLVDGVAKAGLSPAPADMAPPPDAAPPSAAAAAMRSAIASAGSLCSVSACHIAGSRSESGTGGGSALRTHHPPSRATRKTAFVSATYHRASSAAASFT